MGYVSLYRQWRPQNFDELIGQSHIVRTLTHALQQNRAAHAYLFCGPRGTGKTTTARILAKALNCPDRRGAQPCGVCGSCHKIADGVSLDVIEIDGASNRGIDEIRELRERVRLAPSEGNYKVYIIDEVHMLTNEAFNALLKTLEEPPAHVVFILATTESNKLPATIISRCQRFDFRRFALGEIIGSLERMVENEQREAEPAALALIAEHADGGMRDAQGLLDQCLVFSEHRLTVGDVHQVLGTTDRRFYMDLARLLAGRDLNGAYELVGELHAEGKDMIQFARGAVAFFRDLLLLQQTGDPGLVAPFSDSERGDLQLLVGQLPAGTLIRAIEAFTRVEREARDLGDSRLSLQIALARLLVPAAADSGESGNQAIVEAIQALETRLAVLEGKTKLGATPAAAVPSVGETPVRRTEDRQHASDDSGSVRTRPGNKAVPAQGQATTGSDAPGAAQGKGPVQAAGSIPDLKLLRDQWPVVLETLKKEKISLQAFALEASITGLEGNTVILGFTERYTLHREKVQAEHELVERIIQKVTGVPLQIRCVPVTDGNSSGAGSTGGDSASGKPWDDEPAVQAALKVFGGEVQRVGTKKGGKQS